MYLHILNSKIVLTRFPKTNECDYLHRSQAQVVKTSGVYPFVRVLCVRVTDVTRTCNLVKCEKDSRTPLCEISNPSSYSSFHYYYQYYYLPLLCVGRAQRSGVLGTRISSSPHHRPLQSYTYIAAFNRKKIVCWRV